MDNLHFPYTSILAVCSVGVARSPMVVGFLKEIFKNDNPDVIVNSGGIASHARDGMLISLDAKLVMEELGITLSDTSLSIDLKRHPEFINESELILTLTESHKNDVLKVLDGNKKQVLTLREFAGGSGDIEDPSMKGLEGFRKVRDEIKYCVEKGLNKFCV